mmetsp:Transcript_25323/g.34774  ORF Transcript_25323/g.34774 Transcript_25323/m.34774 type:complete len:290 (+) Transcript_25323:5739-6608(+)
MRTRCTRLSKPWSTAIGSDTYAGFVSSSRATRSTGAPHSPVVTCEVLHWNGAGMEKTSALPTASLPLVTSATATAAPRPVRLCTSGTRASTSPGASRKVTTQVRPPSVSTSSPPATSRRLTFTTASRLARTSSAEASKGIGSVARSWCVRRNVPPSSLPLVASWTVAVAPAPVRELVVVRSSASPSVSRNVMLQTCPSWPSGLLRDTDTAPTHVTSFRARSISAAPTSCGRASLVSMMKVPPRTFPSTTVSTEHEAPPLLAWNAALSPQTSCGMSPSSSKVRVSVRPIS